MIPARSQNTERQIQNNFDLKLFQSLEQIVFGENENNIDETVKLLLSFYGEYISIFIMIHNLQIDIFVFCTKKTK